MRDTAAIGEVLASAVAKLGSITDCARLEAETLVSRAIDVPRAYLFAHPEDAPDDDALLRLETGVARRLAGEPMAYITGTKEFWSMDLIVSPAVLVPRPETETLVDVAIRAVPRDANWTILDLGTGSGAVALAIARERPLCTVVATDASAAALDVARLNARELGLANVKFALGDWTAAVEAECFDVVVSNPPYVCAGDDALGQLAMEPAAALVAGADGLDAIRVIARDGAAVLTAGGLLALEHGARQAPAVAGILEGFGWTDIACCSDYAGHPRVTSARRHAFCDT